MNRPSFFEGVAVALAASVVGSALHAALTPILPSGWVLQLLIAGIGLAYIVYLLRRSRERVGRVTALAAWAIMALAAWLIKPPLVAYLLVHIGLIWLIRSLYFYSSLLPALADLALNTLSLAAAIWAATQSGSFFLSIWCFFLVQALFVGIPPRLRRKVSENTAEREREDRFQHAFRCAEAALRKRSSTHRMPRRQEP